MVNISLKKLIIFAFIPFILASNRSYGNVKTIGLCTHLRKCSTPLTTFTERLYAASSTASNHDKQIYCTALKSDKDKWIKNSTAEKKAFKDKIRNYRWTRTLFSSTSLNIFGGATLITVGLIAGYMLQK